MHAPIIWIRRRAARRLIHRFPGAAGGRQILVITPDRQEAQETALAMRERQAARVREHGAADLEALASQRAAWTRPSADGAEAQP
ncbi:MAG: hypothetical protein OXI70_08430 [Chloroflexota bacterium]|nr:hypothetical protein [Chloroflexota bacterium]